MKFNYRIIIGISFLLLAACGNQISTNETTDLKKLVHDYSVGNVTNTDETASITATELIVTDNNDQKTTYDLPEDEFFVSIAPFITETHPCDIHSLTGCQGELVNKDIDVYIEDRDGNIIIDETMNSGENGFLDLWLPRDNHYIVKMNMDGKSVTSQLSTFEDDRTCITTMQLAG